MIKRPGNEFNIVDNSGKYYTTEPLVVAPLMMIVSSFDKGPEDFIEVNGDDFFRLYGENISFEKHGQPAIQAANVILNGGKLLVKRAVADDAHVANAIILATVKKVQIPKIDTKTGKQVYIDSVTGTETLEPSGTNGKNDRALINNATIKYSVVSVENVKTMNELMSAARSMIVERDPLIDSITGENNEEAAAYSARNTDVISDKSQVPSAIPGNIPLPIGALGPEGDESEYTYPLFIVMDNGSGVSSKRFNITPEYILSKTMNFVLYKMENIGSMDLDYEYTRFTTDPGSLYKSTSMSLSETGKEMVQIKPAAFNEGINKFIDKVSEFSGIEREELVKLDILFGCNKRGEKINQITIDEEGYDLTSEFGIPLLYGDYGSFTDHPFGTQAYTDKLVEIFQGYINPEIFDVEQHKIEVCVDANYPLEVKNTITELVNWRKDFFFFRDLGIGLESNAAIELAMADLKSDSYYCATYCQSYDVIDPFTKQQITVTIGYDLARLLINHLNNNRNAPMCGELYSAHIPDHVDGTISYIPRIMPNVDQKQLLTDMHVNYASIINNRLTLEQQLTTQVDETQLSWINNVLAIQAMIRDIRINCPKSRYSFIDNGSGALQKYAKDVEEVIARHKSNFSEVEFEYSADPLELANRIFKANILVKCKEYVDFEQFTITVFD